MKSVAHSAYLPCNGATLSVSSKRVILTPHLKTEREARNLTRRNLAVRIGMEYVRLWALESGRTSATVAEVGNIAQALDVNPLRLMKDYDVEGEYVVITYAGQVKGLASKAEAIEFLERLTEPYLLANN